MQDPLVWSGFWEGLGLCPGSTCDTTRDKELQQSHSSVPRTLYPNPSPPQTQIFLGGVFLSPAHLGKPLRCLLLLWNGV